MNELSHRKNDHILRFHLLLGDMIDDDSRRQMTRAIAYIEREQKSRIFFAIHKKHFLMNSILSPNLYNGKKFLENKNPQN